MLEPNWPANKDWQRGQSRPEQVNLRFYMTAGFTLAYLCIMVVLNLYQWPAIDAELNRFIASGFTRLDPLLMLPAMLFIGLLGLPRLGREYLRWRRERGLVLQIDPVPAAPDGQLGGSLIIPLSLPASVPLRVTLHCMRRVVTRGKNASMRDELLWQAPAPVRRQRSIKGTRIEFCAELSPEQPGTSFDGGHRKVWWAVRVEVPESNLDATFPVPVRAGAAKKRSSYRFSEQERSSALEAVREPVQSWRASEAPEGVCVDYPAGRSSKAAWILLLIGLAFTAVFVFMGYSIREELGSPRISYFALMVQGMILFGFGLFGPALLAGGLYLLLNRLTLRANAQELVATRTLFGLSRQRRLPLDEVEGMAKRIIGRVGQGVDSELEYAIDAYLKDGQRLRLGDGIRGQSEAEQLLELLHRTTGIHCRADPSAYRMRRRPSPAWVKGLPVVFRLIGMLVFGLTIAAFVIDFF
ncbi:hypothetical protein [Marinobacterium aestuariivivens]|uniref:Type II secretion system protein GspF domain-containing protein n=1 Tax=Marinobacterium aestuariivivens TaxID=1698799 RepID=A0ABW2A055_9GAMM